MAQYAEFITPGDREIEVQRVNVFSKGTVMVHFGVHFVTCRVTWTGSLNDEELSRFDWPVVIFLVELTEVGRLALPVGSPSLWAVPCINDNTRMR